MDNCFDDRACSTETKILRSKNKQRRKRNQSKQTIEGTTAISLNILHKTSVLTEPLQQRHCTLMLTLASKHICSTCTRKLLYGPLLERFSPQNVICKTTSLGPKRTIQRQSSTKKEDPHQGHLPMHSTRSQKISGRSSGQVWERLHSK